MMDDHILYYLGAYFDLLMTLASIAGYFYILNKTGQKWASILVFGSAWVVSALSYVLLVNDIPSNAWYITLLRVITYLLFLVMFMMSAPRDHQAVETDKIVIHGIFTRDCLCPEVSAAFEMPGDRRLQNIPDIDIRRSPAQDVPCLVGRGYRTGRVPCSSGSVLGLDVQPKNLQNGKDFSDGMSLPGSQVHGVRSASCQ